MTKQEIKDWIIKSGYQDKNMTIKCSFEWRNIDGEWQDRSSETFEYMVENDLFSDEYGEWFDFAGLVERLLYYKDNQDHRNFKLEILEAKND